MSNNEIVKNDEPRSNKALIIWLMSVCIVIFCMIIIGGVTRLTESGLSMVEWRPLIGIVPPIGESQWQAVFHAYKEFPQYQKVNLDMDLAAFKSIFYWEYGHRVLGRLIGVLFFIPFIVFMFLRKVPKLMVPKLWIGLVLGGLQGLMGWYMVKSGLIDMPRVSHYRLAAHLILALIILTYLSWLIMDLWPVSRIDGLSAKFKLSVKVLFFLLFTQILYGAFVAGSRAGYGYNTFPSMNGELIPAAAWQLSPFILNFLENNAMLQFVHRWLGATILLLVIFIAYQTYRIHNFKLNIIVAFLTCAIAGQFLLGVFTLLMVVPISLASVHQACACIVLVSALVLVYFTASKSKTPMQTGPSL